MIKVIILSIIIFSIFIVERLSAERDVTNSLLSENRTHFIFSTDLKVTNTEIIKGE